MDTYGQGYLGSRRGVALIMVIGMLALMMVMAVAFAIFMRTERVASGNFRSDVRARNMLHVALNRAVQAIDDSLVSSNAIYPSWDTMSTSSDSGYVREVLTANALAQIPMGALTPQGVCEEGGVDYVVIPTAVSGSRGAVINLTDHSFGLITNVVSVGGGRYLIRHTLLSGGDDNSWAGGTDQYYVLQPGMKNVLVSGNLVGRYGYVVINCSGLLDANYVGGGTRGIGTNVTEIQIQSMPGVDAAKLVAERNITPFETQQELVLRGRASGAFSGYPDDFVCYSSGVTNDSRVYIGGTAAELLGKKDEIIRALTNLAYQDVSTPSTNFTLAEAEVLFTNLIDYVDADRLPGNLDGTCSANPDGPFVEAIPMANEVVISNVYFCTFNTVSSNYNVSGAINCFAEFAMPFKGLRPFDQRFKYSMVVTGMNSSALFNYNGTLSNTPAIVNWGAAGDYLVQTVSGAALGGVVANLSFTNSAVSCGVRLSTIDIANNLVDRTQVLQVSLSALVQWNGANATITLRGSKECEDPRLNHDTARWQNPYLGLFAHTLGADNFWALRAMNRTGSPPPAVRFAAEGRDGDLAMYVPVAGARIASAGELGYLFFGNMWETVRLARLGTRPNYGQLHAVLDYFTAYNHTNGIVKGRVNVNTRNEAVIVALLQGLPLNKRHSGATTPVTALTESQVNAVKAALVNRVATNRFDSIAELGAIRWELIDSTWSSLDKESIIRNTCELLNLRQNFYVVLLYADAVKQDIDGNISSLSTVMGVAEVWRDPMDPVRHYPVNVYSMRPVDAE